MTRAERITTEFVRCVIDYRRVAIFLGVLLLIPCAVACTGLRVNNTITTWFLESDPYLQSYYAYQKVFGNDEVAVIAFREPTGLFTPATLELLRTVSRRIGAQRHVQRVLSIATATAIEGKDGTLSVRPVLAETGPIDAAQAARVRQVLLDDPIYRGNILSDDQKTTLLLVQMKAMQDIDAARTEALQEIRKVLQEEVASRGLGYAVGGIGVIYDALNQITVTEGGVLIALSYLVIITAMMLILRNWRFAFLGLGVVYVTVTATMGIYALRGHMLNMVTVILPSMLLVIIIMDFVHVVMNFYHCGPIPKSREERRLTVIERVGHIALPCFYTSLTNGTGFLALAISPISLVRDLGLYGALGSFLEWGVTIPICALALYWMDPVVDFHPTSPEGWMQRLLSWMTQRVIAHRVAVSSAVLAVTAFFTWGMTRIVVDTYTIGYFRESHPVRSDHAFIEKNFGYYIPIELTVKAAKGKTFKDPAMLEKLQRIEECLLAEPVISKVLSLLPFSKRVHQVLNGGEPAKYQIPPSRQAASQELLLYEMDPDASLDQYMTRDYAFGRVSGRMKMMSVRPGKVMMEKLDGRLQGIMGADGHPEFAGYLPLYVKIIDYLVQSQIQSFTLAFLLVFGPMYLLFRSVRLTIISIVPNVLPVIYTLGFMGWAGIPLDIATVTIASIVLGIVVDDTIHFLHGFRERWDAGMDPRQATVEVIESTGKAVVTSTLMMFFGFSVMGISSVKPIAYFGVLSGMSFIAGVVCEFLVTPVLLIVFYPKPCPTPVRPGQ